MPNTHKEFFTGKGEVITFDGFLKFYILEGVDDDDSEVSGCYLK
jgi:hypothetical protein